MFATKHHLNPNALVLSTKYLVLSTASWPRLRTGFARALLPALLSLVVFAGCPSSSGPPRYKISGKVTFQGQPVEEGNITFSEPTTGQVNEGPLGPGGTYATEIPAGSYKVS